MQPAEESNDTLVARIAGAFNSTVYFVDVRWHFNRIANNGNRAFVAVIAYMAHLFLASHMDTGRFTDVFLVP